MWIFTQDGFVSAVRHTEKPGYLMIRARDAKSLHTLAAMADVTVVKTPTADYPYRVTVDDATYKQWLSVSVDDLDYANFKSQVAISRGYNFAHTLTGVWSIMHDVEDGSARKRVS
jgi:hypothetical protein